MSSRKFQICGRKRALAKFSIPKPLVLTKTPFCPRIWGILGAAVARHRISEVKTYMLVLIISEIYFFVDRMAKFVIRTYERSNEIRNPDFRDILAKKVTKSKI